MRIKLYTCLAATFLLFSSFSFSQKEKDPVLMTIDGNKITKSQFLRTYLKNNDDPKYDKQTLDNYMELYKAFRLKVAEAEALQYDTIPSLIKELKGYDNQLAQPYLVDSSKINELVKEAYDRMKTEIEASHIMVKLGANAPPEDTLKAYHKIMAIRNRIVKGGESFEEVAIDASEDPSVKRNKGNLGYFTAFQMVYPFETAAYNLDTGKISMPVRSRYGYHIIKKTGERPARGTITVEHIMIALPKNSAESEVKKAQNKINELYKKLQEGEDSFEKLARLYSEDRGSKNKGGKLPPFGTGTTRRMVPNFEKEAFQLKKDGDYTQPFRTNYGFHIVKRIDFKPLGTYEELKEKIRRKVKKGPRGKVAQKAFIQNLKQTHPFKEQGDEQLEWFYNHIDTTVFTKNWEKPELDKNKWLFAYRGNKYDSQSFLNYIASKNHPSQMPIKTFINDLYKKWQNKKVLEDEKSRLSEEYPDYKALLQEYHDGVLLYQIMKEKVWDKAIQDSAGLHEYYTAHLDNYQWPERIQATIYSSDQKEMVLEAKMLSKIDSMTTDDIMNKVNADAELNLFVQKGKYVQSENDILATVDLKKKATDIFKKDNKYYFVLVEETLPPGPKKLSEARGTIIQDYQNYLEKSWLKKLNKKHEVKINYDVLYNLGQ